MSDRVTVQALSVAALAGAAAIVLADPVSAEGCHAPKGIALGVSRIINIDTSGGPIFGKIKRYEGEPGFLKPREVVLTFDDGPAPSITRKILKTLQAYCAKATFFPVGRMAIAYPEVVREVARAGHTIGSHTWSHPLNLRRLRADAATYQVEKGFAAVAMAAGAPIAPFFRFPGLNDDGAVLKRLQRRGIATFSVDVVTNDSFETDVDQLVEQSVRRVIHGNGGIVLFHDIKMTTAHALPRILAQLKKRGFRLVHLTSKNAFKPVDRYDGELREKFARATSGRPLPEAPLRAPLHPVGAFAIVHPPVTELSPEAKTIKRRVADHKGNDSPAHKTPTRHGWGAVVAKERSKTGRP